MGDIFVFSKVHTIYNKNSYGKRRQIYFALG